MTGSKQPNWRLQSHKLSADLRDERAKVFKLGARIKELETKLKFHSATYSEGGSGEYINNSRFE